MSDLEPQEPICFRGIDRSKESMAVFYDFLGTPRVQQIQLAVMNMWNPFWNATETSAPQAAILYDKFHVSEACLAPVAAAQAIQEVRQVNRATLGRDYRLVPA